MSIEVLPVLEALVGIPALIALLINVLKGFKVVKPGQSELWSKVLNAVVFLSLYLLATLAPDVDLLAFDGIAKTVSDLGLAILGIIPIGSLVSGKVHDGIKGVPVFGMSHSE